MSYSISFLESAEHELFDTVLYYNKQAPGLGFEFASEVQKAIERILRYPKAWKNYLKIQESVDVIAFHIV